MTLQGSGFVGFRDDLVREDDIMCAELKSCKICNA